MADTIQTFELWARKTIYFVVNERKYGDLGFLLAFRMYLSVITEPFHCEINFWNV